MSALDELAESLVISEERKQEIDRANKRFSVDHSLLLHRDKASATDIEAMIAHLRAAGMPDTATLRIDGPDNHTRMVARWSSEGLPR